MKKMNMRLWLLASALIIALNSCKKEEPIVIANADENLEIRNCEPFPKPDISSGDPSDYSEYSENFVSHLETNPSNPNEIVYIEGNFPNSKLIRLNILTSEKKVIYNEQISSQLSWSVKDWILFQRTYDLNIYKIKSNGDSLTQLTFVYEKYHHAIWDPKGERIMVYNKFNTAFKTEIMDEAGHVIDSMPIWNHRNGEWTHPRYYIGSKTNELVILDMYDKTLKKKIIFGASSNIKSLGWVSSNEILYSDNNKLYRYNIDTDFAQIISHECYRMYNAISSTRDFSRIIALQTVASAKPNYITYFESRILEMKPSGEVIQEIFQ